MGGLFQHYLSMSFDNLWEENVIYAYDIFCIESNIILGSPKDLLGVCEGIVWAVA